MSIPLEKDFDVDDSFEAYFVHFNSVHFTTSSQNSHRSAGVLDNMVALTVRLSRKLFSFETDRHTHVGENMPGS